MRYFHNLSSAFGCNAPSPTWASTPGPCWVTFVSRPLICSPMKKILWAPMIGIDISNWPAMFCHQRTDHLEQSASCTTSYCTTSTRAVTERFHTYTEEAPVLVRPAPLRRLTRFRRRICIHRLTYLLTSRVTIVYNHAFSRRQSRQPLDYN